MEISAHGKTDIGQQRALNEDALLIDQQLGLFAVADGVGGHAAGEVAAALTMRTIGEHVRDRMKLVRRVLSGNQSHHDLVRLVTEAALLACRSVHLDATNAPERSGMACTLTALLVAGNQAAMAHVGDSRLYLQRDGACEQLSTDHTLAHDLLRSGTLTALQAKETRYSRVLTRSIGGQAMVEVESLILDVLPDDTFLICSDGLSDSFESLSEVAAGLSQETVADLPDELVRLANERGGRDNITALVLRAQASDAEQEQLHQLGSEIRARVQALRRVGLFGSVRFVNLLRLLELSQLEEHAQGDVVIARDQTLERMLLVLNGRYRLESPGREPQVLRPGSCLGQTALLAERACRATLSAEQAGQLLSLKSSRFLELCSRRPWLGVDLLKRLATELSREVDARDLEPDRLVF